MAAQEYHKLKVKTGHFHILAPVPPFVDVILQCNSVTPQEFSKIARLAASYANDPRMIEMVRKAGDASAKVPYLMAEGETPHSVLTTLRQIAQPHVEHLKTLPSPMQATIHTLLSINMAPSGYEEYGIPALLEIERIQREIVGTLRTTMTGRKLAEQFHQDNKAALEALDRDWLHVRKGDSPWPFPQSLPDRPQMQYIPTYYKNCLVAMHEVCVIVDAPDAKQLRELTPPVLRYPLPENEPAPMTGSADWLLRVVGKIGRHFTRALLDIIKTHLEMKRVTVEAHNYDFISNQAQEALRQFVERTP